MASSLVFDSFRRFKVYRKRNLRFDFVSGLVVFLVAIPLCLGIALASGAPLFSGIISGIIGGIVVGSISGSHVSVSGPAAGMAVVVLTAITQLADFHVFLLALFLSGLLQISMSLFRAGFIADYIPSNVVQGLLSAIGILLIIKQLPLAFSASDSLTELKGHLLDSSEGITLKPLHDLTYHINNGALLISVLSLAILLFFDKTKLKFFRSIPGAIVVVVTAAALNQWFVYTHSYLALHPHFLVNIPTHDGIGDFISQVQTPDWSAWHDPRVYVFAMAFAFIGSLETLLNIKAAERLDKKRRICSKDKELMAQGIGNSLSGLIGGLPITSVIVRTSVNIQSNAKTKLSTIFHGIFLLSSVILIPATLNKIPLAALAAILMYTGYKLTKPSIYKMFYKQGHDRFIPFIVTILAILIFNLLLGILIGLMVSLFYILRSNSQARIDIIQEIYPKGITNRLVLPQQISFLNKASLVAELNSLPKKSQLIIDARYTRYIDKEIIEYLKDFQKEVAPRKDISLNLIGFKEKYDIHDHINFINVTTFDVQSMLTPKQVLRILKEGNQRFLDETGIHRRLQVDIKHTATTQHPIAVVLGCIDSRVPVETIFDMSFGDLFCIRVAGNIANDDVLASMEYACHAAGAKLILVLGHSRCGAISAACDNVDEGHITQLLAKIKPAIDAETETTENRTSNNNSFVKHVTELNVAHTIHQIYQNSTILRDLIQKSSVGIAGATYEVHSGKVRFQNFASLVSQFPKHDPSLPEHLEYITEDDSTAS